MVHRTVGKAALGAALAAAAALGGCASNYGTGESPEVAIFREMTGGILSPKKEPVVHKPRAPLVLPPSAGQLPPPVPAPQVASSQWPDDPDRGTKGAKVFAENPRDEVSQDEYRRLKPLAAATRGAGPASDPKLDGMSALARSRKERAAFESGLNAANGFSGERRYLTDPPDSVREPSPTAPQVIEPKKRGNILTRMFTRG